MKKIIYMTAVTLLTTQVLSAPKLLSVLQCESLFSQTVLETQIQKQIQTASQFEARGTKKLQVLISPYADMDRLSLRNYIMEESRKEAGFRRMQESRGLSKYNDALGRDTIFLKTLKSTIENQQTWIDVGGGNGEAIKDTINNYIPYHQLPKLKSILVSIGTEVKPTEQVAVFSDRYFEDISNSELSKSGLITDVYGAMSYSTEPHVVLQKYWDLLSNHGKALIYQGANKDDFGKNNKVITRDGQILELRDWVVSVFHGQAKINTFNVESEQNGDVQMNTLIIEKNNSIQVQVPELEIINFKPGLPPTFLFKEKGESSVDKNVLLKAMQKKSYDFISTQKNKVMATEFLDAFRSGSWSNPLISSIKNLQKNEMWLNVGPFADKIGEGLSESPSAFEFHKQSDFLWIDQKIMELKARGIHWDQFKYQSAEAIDQLHIDQKANLITDYNGDMVLKYNPVVTLKKYAMLLNPGGRIFIAMGTEENGLGLTTEVRLKDGRQISLRSWLTEHVPGIKAKFHRISVGRNFGVERSFVEIEVTNIQALLKVRQLGLVGFSQVNKNEVAVPLFQEK